MKQEQKSKYFIGETQLRDACEVCYSFGAHEKLQSVHILQNSSNTELVQESLVYMKCSCPYYTQMKS